MVTAPADLPPPPATPYPSPPSGVILQDVDWVVITPDTLPTMEEWVLIGLEPDDYDRLLMNQAELLRWITEARRRMELARSTQQAERDQ